MANPRGGNRSGSSSSGSGNKGKPKNGGRNEAALQKQVDQYNKQVEEHNRKKRKEREEAQGEESVCLLVVMVWLSSLEVAGRYV